MGNQRPEKAADRRYGQKTGLHPGCGIGAIESGGEVSGLIITKKGRFVFRDDISADQRYFAWSIDDPDVGWRVMTHKWQKLPRGYLEVFSLDFPPETVSYIPCIG